MGDKAEQARSELILQQRKEARKKVAIQRKIVDKRIKQNLKQAREIEYKRKEDFDLKQMQVAEQRERLEFQSEQERMLARKQQELLARKRQMVLEETRYEEEMRKEELLAQQEAMDENLRRIEAGRARERALKKEVKMLNMQMKQDTVERMERVEEYKRLETIRHLKECEDRTNRMQAQKKHILAQRKKAGVDAKMQRESIQRAMEKVKVSKKWHQAGKILNKAMAKGTRRTKSTSKPGSVKRAVLPSVMTEDNPIPPTMQPAEGDADVDAGPVPYKSPYETQQITV